MEIVSIFLIQWLFLVLYRIIEWWIDIPNVETVNLPNSFEYVLSTSVTSRLVNNHEWIDVSPILASFVPTTYNCDYIESIESNVTSIHLPDRLCNNLNYTTFNFSRFSILEELIIGNNSFMNVNEFVIDGMNELKTLTIGMNSFTKALDSNDYDSSRSFSIMNCIELESIKIDHHSFSDYAGGFELKNLPKLSTIKIGEIGSGSFNFYSCSFEIKGIIDDIDNE